MKNQIFMLIAILFSCAPNAHENNKETEAEQMKMNVNSITVEVDTINSLNDSLSNSIANENDSLNSDEKRIAFIKAFYTEYIKAMENIKTRNSDTVKLKYCTPELLQRLSKSKLDFDPFINAQDFDDNLLKTLNVKVDTTQENRYIMSYVDTFTDSKVFVVLELKKLENDYKINDIDIPR